MWLIMARFPALMRNISGRARRAIYVSQRIRKQYGSSNLQDCWTPLVNRYTLYAQSVRKMKHEIAGLQITFHIMIL